MAFQKIPTIGPLTEYLERLKELRTHWGLDEGGEVSRNGESLWFRGHQDAAWKLTPKIYRKEFAEADENEIRQEFQSRALQLVQGSVPVDKWGWYFLMQHCGAPTRLLDWTDNPLIGIYFAVVDHPGNCDAAVWAINPWWLNRNLRRGVRGPILSDWQIADSYLKDLDEAFAGVRIRSALPAAIDPPHVDRRLACPIQSILDLWQGP